MKKALLLFSLLFVLLFAASAQQTLMTVPSADVLDKGKSFVRFDLSYAPETVNFGIAPNFVYGTNLLGKKTEVGVNLETISKGDVAPISIVPNVKVRLFESISESQDSLTTIYVGTKLYLPVHNKSYGSAGNYFYAAGSFLADSGTRFTAGVYNQQNVFARGNRTGVLLGFEQWVHGRDIDGQYVPDVTPQVDWQSGHGGNGYLSLGVQILATKKIFVLPSYALGNSSVGRGNHAATLYVGFYL